MIDTSKYEGHTPAPWTYNNVEGRAIWKCLFNGECFTDPSTYGKEGYEEVPIATMAPLPEGEYFPEEEFTRMMADKKLMADAPLLLEEVKRLREAIVGMVDSIDNYYIRDVQHAAGCLRDLIGYYDEEE